MLHRSLLCAPHKLCIFRAPVLQRRWLLSLAIETSCDDTCVAILEKHEAPKDGSSSTKSALQIHHHARLTSNNLEYRGIHPVVALASHQQNLGKLVQDALAHLPVVNDDNDAPPNAQKINVPDPNVQGHTQLVRAPDIISATRGPGMRSNLHTGLDTAKGLALAWNVPLLAVNHMQAHALTPRLVSALSQDPSEAAQPAFPFLSLLVSGGHTLLLHTKSLNDYEILAETSDIALGDCLDKIARAVLPASILTASTSTSYGALLEAFAFPQVKESIGYGYTAPRNRKEELARYVSPHGWSLLPPLADSKNGSRNRDMEFCFSGLASACERILAEPGDPAQSTSTSGSVVAEGTAMKGRLDPAQRRELAQTAMRIAFEHLATRIGFALDGMRDSAAASHARINTLVVSGGVAANRYLKHVLTTYLYARGHKDITLSTPPLELCTDNAVMIGWTGIEMYEAGWESELGCRALRKWPLDARVEGGILGAGAWKRRPGYGDGVKDREREETTLEDDEIV